MDPITMGALVMGGSSILGGIMSSSAQEKAAKAQAAAQLRGIQLGIDEQRQAYKDIKPYWDPYMEAGQQSLGNLMQMQERGEFNQPTLGQFQYGGQVEDFLDPSMDFQRQEAMDAMQSQYGADQYSGAAMRALQDRSQQMAQTDYGNAFGRMQSDRAFNYQDYINQFRSEGAGITDKWNRMSNMANLGVQGASTLTNARMGQASNISGLQQSAGVAQGQSAAAGPLGTAANWQTMTNPNVIGPAFAGLQNAFAGQSQQQQQAYNPSQYQYAMNNPMQQNISPYMQNPMPNNFTPQGNI